MDEKSRSSLTREKVLNWVEIIFVGLAIGVRVYFIYLPFKVFNYLVVPGDDAVNHYKMVNEVLSGQYDYVYPKLFHFLIAKFSLLTGMGVMDSLKAVTPLLIILPSIAIYIFARKQFGRLAGILCFMIMLWGGTNYALVAFGDGNYPNIIAAGFFMPLALCYMLESLKKGKLYNYLMAALFFALTVLTHHLTTAMVLIIVLVYLIVLGIWNHFEKVAPNFKKIAIFIVVLVGLMVAVISFTDLKTVFVSAWNNLFANGSTIAVKSFAKLVEYDEYPGQIGGLTWYGGLISLFYLIYLMGQKDEGKHRAAYLLIVVWFAVLFMASRSSSIGLPGRFTREIAFPAALSIGIMAASLFNQLSRVSKIFAVGIFGFIIFANLTQINSGLYKAPEYFNRMIWFSYQDKEITDYLGSSTDFNDRFVANPITPYLPVFAGRQIAVVNTDNLAKINEAIGSSGAKYILIGPKTPSGPAEDAYGFFANYDKTTEALNKLVKQKKMTVTKEFAYGAVLYQIKPSTKN